MIILSTILLNKYAVLDLCCDNDYEMKNLNYIKIIGRFSFNDLSNKKKKKKIKITLNISIESHSFSDCSSLQSFEFEKKSELQTLNDFAFDCTLLSRFFFHKHVKKIEKKKNIFKK